MPRCTSNMMAVAAMLCLSLNPVARAADYTVLTHPLPPFTKDTAAGPTGLAVDLVDMILSRTGDTGTVQVEPYARLMHDVQQGHATIGFIVARTPAREGLMQWLGPIVVVPVRLYMKAGAAVVPRSLEEARTLGRIGVARGGVDAHYFEQNGFGNLDYSDSQATTLRKIYLGRVDATPIGSLVFDSLLDEIGLKRSDFVWAPLRLYDSAVYAAVSPDVPASVVQSWSAALDELKRSGDYAALLARYGIDVEPEGKPTAKPAGGGY